MKNKNFWNSLNTFKPGTPEQVEVERKLLPRLRVMGYLLVGISVLTFTYAIVAPKEEELYYLHQEEKNAFFQENELSSGLSLATDDTPFELNPSEVLNFFVVSATFAGVGGLLLFTCWNRRKLIFLKNNKRK